MRKKIIATFLLLLLPFSLISCSENKNLSSNAPSIEENTSNGNNSNSDKSDLDENKSESSKESSNEDEVKSKDVRLYYYNAVADKIVYSDKTIEVKGKAVATAIVNSLKEAPTSDIRGVISKDISLISANLDSSKDTITLDFSDNFVKAQNLGGGVEASTLTALVNTFGYNFKVNNVIITLGGKPYESGHFSKASGEAFKVNYDNITELQK
ncbi:hypothetical protein JCM1393_26090 [Clostridium carnis]